MKKYLFIVLLIGFAFGQAPDTLWTKTFGSNDGEIGRQIINTFDGGFAIGGTSQPLDTSLPNKGYFLKLNSEGIEEWNLYFDNISDISITSIHQNTDGSYICSGQSDLNDDLLDFLLLKINSNGTLDWSNVYESYSTGWAMKVIQTNDGGYVMVGTQYTDETFYNYKIKVIKTDFSGIIDWEYDYGSTAHGTSILENNESELIISGSDNENNIGIILSLSSNGVLNWDRYIDQVQINSIKSSTNDGYIVTGSAGNAPERDLVILKTDSRGIEEWRKSYGGENDDVGYSIELTQSGGYIITGFKTNLSADVYILRVDELGDEMWNITFGEDSSLEPTNDKAYSIIKTPDNGYAIAGYTTSFGSGGFDYWLIRLEAEVLETIDSKISPETFQLYQNYPNPFNPTTSLRYDLPNNGLVNITIYDMMGRIVKTLVNSSQTAGYKSVQWNATNDRDKPVSAGLYLYSIQAGEFRQTKKMVLLK